MWILSARKYPDKSSAPLQIKINSAANIILRYNLYIKILKANIK